MDAQAKADESVPSITLDARNTTMDWGANLTSPQPGNVSGDVVPDGCVVLQFEDFIPWDNPDNIVTADFEALVDQIKSAYILPAFFAIGGPTNCINLAVFYKQGLKDRINLCLFALSLADGLYLLQLMFFNGDQIAYQERLTKSKILAEVFYFEHRKFVESLDALVYGVVIPGTTCAIV
nr:hypothetical protein BaRGS_000765 [Batillaria attramentaria]